MRDFVPQQLGPGERCQPGLGPTLSREEQCQLHVDNQRREESYRRFNIHTEQRRLLRAHRDEAFRFVMKAWGAIPGYQYKRWLVPTDRIRLPPNCEIWEPNPFAWVYRNINKGTNQQFADNGNFVVVDEFDVGSYWSID